MFYCAERKGKTLHLLKQGAKSVQKSRKRKRHEVFEMQRQSELVIHDRFKADAHMEVKSHSTSDYRDITMQLRRKPAEKAAILA